MIDWISVDRCLPANLTSVLVAIVDEDARRFRLIEAYLDLNGGWRTPGFLRDIFESTTTKAIPGVKYWTPKPNIECYECKKPKEPTV